MYKKYLITGVLLLVIVGLFIAIITPSPVECKGKNDKNSSCYYLLSKYDTLSNGAEQYRVDNFYPDSVMIDCFSIYVENSASIDPYLQVQNKTNKNSYVDAFTKFKEVADQLLTDVTDISNSNKCYYINDTIIEYKDKGRDFGRYGLTLDNIKNKKGYNNKGDRSNTELSFVIDTIVKRNSSGEISVLISDFIPSPKGSSENDIERYISSISNKVKGSLKSKLSSQPQLCIMLYRYNSQFDGIYYGTNDENIRYKGHRPFYVMFIGNYGLLSKLKNKSKIMNGSEPCCVYFASQNDIPFGVFSGQLKPFSDENHSGIHKHLILTDELKEKAKNKDGELFIKLKMDLSCLPIEKDYLLDTANYVIESECFYIEKIDEVSESKDKQKYTHVLTLKNNKTTLPNNNRIRVLLKAKKYDFEQYSSMAVHQEMYNSSDSIKTLGIEPLRQGIEDAFNEKSKHPLCYAVFEFLIN